MALTIWKMSKRELSTSQNLQKPKEEVASQPNHGQNRRSRLILSKDNNRKMQGLCLCVQKSLLKDEKGAILTLFASPLYGHFAVVAIHQFNSSKVAFE